MIDPIPVAEEMQRIRKQEDILRRRGDGALALAWFSTHALSKTGDGPRCTINGVLPDSMKPVASATPDAEKVLPYLSRSFCEHHRRIIERAIELASEDFKGK